MAVYKNREVSVSTVNVPSTNIDLVSITYTNGMHDSAPLRDVYFTAEEKKTLIKDNPSRFEHVSLVSDADLKLIRQGVSPEDQPKTVKKS